ncbi:MAG: hypothetical protein AB1730_05920 [Myxococcota bacterium]
MYAPRHLVFCGPGRLPAELREVVARRTGTRLSDLPVMAPRLLGIFDTAAEAERVAAGLQRLKIGALVAGPEQPPVLEGWTVARSLELFAGQWRVTTAAGVTVILDLAELQAVTVVDWRPEDRPVDRAVLLRPRDGGRPVLLRATEIDRVSAQALPGRGLQQLGQLLDDCGGALPADARVRQRKLTPAELEEATLGIDLLPLAVAMVEKLDLQPYELPRPLSRRAAGAEAPGPAPRPRGPASVPTGTGALAWTLYAAAIALGPVCLLLLGAGALLGSLSAVAAGVLAGAVGSRRLGWAQWLAHERWGDDTTLPRWPRSKSEQPQPPRYPDLLLDAGLVTATLWGAFAGPPLSLLMWVLLLPITAVAGMSALSVWIRSRLDD